MSINKTEFFIISFLTFLGLTSCNQVSKQQLPIYNPSDMDQRVIDKSMTGVTVSFP